MKKIAWGLYFSILIAGSSFGFLAFSGFINIESYEKDFGIAGFFALLFSAIVSFLVIQKIKPNWLK